jgi:hypothetical protein
LITPSGWAAVLLLLDSRNPMSEALGGRNRCPHFDILAYLTNEVAEGLVDVYSELGRRFDEWAFESPCQFTALFGKRIDQSKEKFSTRATYHWC